MMDGMTVQQNAPMQGEATRQPSLDTVIARSVESRLSLRHWDDNWALQLKTDATIPAEYILLHHYLGTIDPALDKRIARYLRSIQGEHGGWPLFYGGGVDPRGPGKAHLS